MATNTRENSATGRTTIKPAEVRLTARTPAAGTPATRHDKRRYYLTGLTLFALLAVALAVVYLLPERYLPASDPPPPAAADTAQPISPAPAPPPAAGKQAVSPWEKAMQSELRRETQTILSKMLEAQQALADHGVQHWAADEYEAAMQHARAGDDFYNRQEFARARDAYQQALDGFSGLVEQQDIVFNDAIDRGHQALQAGNSAAAREAFGLALAIDDLDRQAIAGMERAEVLDEVLALVRKGDRLLANGEFQAAKALYQQALELDPETTVVDDRIDTAEAGIREREFQNRMSAGFAALSQNNLEQARQAFSRARQLKPDSVEARNALTQTEHKITSVKINRLLARARKAEREEQWHDALSGYQAALAIDDSLADAQAGAARTELRAQVHDRLQQIIANPERLYDPEVHEETLVFHQKVSRVSDPGPVLRQQLATVGKLLEQADTPVQVRLESDNQTRVEIYQVGDLGVFHTRELSLKPGRYVAIGYRDGYQDVRKEFFVRPEDTGQVIRIEADTKISAAR